MDTSSPRDLPLWARVIAAGVLVVLAWYAGHTPVVVEWLGGAVIELSAGLVAGAVVYAWKVPVGLWPTGPRRERFSPLMALAVGVFVGGLVLAGSGTELPTRFWNTGRSAVAVFGAGVAVWALAVGTVRVEAFGKWFGLAAGAAVGPVLLGVATLGVAGQLRPLVAAEVVGAFSFTMVITTAASLVTLEFAFRRVLVGQSGDAGVLVVLGAAAASVAWHLTYPVETIGWIGPVGVFLNALVLGALYVLSRSLLVTAVFHGIQLGLTSALSYSEQMSLGLGQRFWVANAIGVGLAALWLGYYVYRQNGWVGAVLSEPIVDDVTDD